MVGQGTNTASSNYQRVILVGASNLIRSSGLLFQFLEDQYGPNLNIMAALGHGRSYGLSNRVLIRRLPSILSSRLWQDLQQQPVQQTLTLLTDIGNDLLYGVSVTQIVTWVEECVKKLKKFSSKIIITGLPVSNLDCLSNFRFLFFRSLFFPQCKIELSEIKIQALTLHNEVKLIAKQYDCEFIEMNQNWYGLDPIHFKNTMQKEVWESIFAAVQSRRKVNNPRRKMHFLKLRTYLSVPAERQFFFWNQQATQPSFKLASGSTISLY